MAWIDTECAYCGDVVWRITYPSWERRKQSKDRYCSKACSNKAHAKGAVKAQGIKVTA